jgi:membrane dipeptidase
MQAYFRAAADLERANAAAAAAGKPQQSHEAFEAAWNAAHTYPETHIDAVLDQIDYGVKLVGIDHIGLGSDFDGVDGHLPVELRTVADYPNLVAGLQQRGYRDADIRKILGGNLLRVWREVEARAVR